MSDCCINIRFLFWYFQITTYKKCRFGFNDWLWQQRRKEALMKPLWIYEFDLKRWGTQSSPKCLKGIT